MATEEDITKYLRLVKISIDNKNFDFKTSDKRKLYELGISFREALNIVKNLKVNNFYRGPTKDHNNKGNLIYEFGYDYSCKLQLYIKLTYRKAVDLFIMSFHKTTKQIKYKFK